MNIKEILPRVSRLYFMGIGGSSMSSLAQIARHRGYNVAGSDMQESDATRELARQGIRIYLGQTAENIDSEQPELIVRTDAIANCNPELLRAKEVGIPVFRRAEFLGWLLDSYPQTVGVAGTHGKTTTTSMITSVFLSAGKNPDAIIGGHMNRINASFRLGNGETCIFESCEFKESFHYFYPNISVVLNIAQDHMEYFHTQDNLIRAFRRYLDNIRPGGLLIANAEDDNSRQMLKTYSGPLQTFGLEHGNYQAEQIVLQQGLPSFELWYHSNGDRPKELLGRICLSVPGQHNIKNALAAAAACHVCGISGKDIAEGLHAYNGAGRRFEYYCTVNGAVIADDYGHHPDAYAVTFATARDLGFRRIFAIHQPHTFSRTKMLMDDFVRVLSTVDGVLIPPIYPARETNDAYHIDARDVVGRLNNAEYLPDFEHIADRVKQLAQPGDLFITLGCGDIYKAARRITEKYGETIYKKDI